MTLYRMLSNFEYNQVGNGSPDHQENQLLDLSYLTEREKELIRRVIKKDVMMNKRSLCSLEIAVTDGREDQNFHRHSKSFSWSPVCSCCGSSFNTVCDVMFSNKCAQCKNLTCRMCMKKVKKRRFCTVCYKERLFDLQSHEVPLVQSRDLKSYATSEMFGSYLLQASLDKAPSLAPSKVKAVTLPRQNSIDISVEAPPNAEFRSRVQTAPADILLKKRRGSSQFKALSIPERLEEYLSDQEMDPVDNKSAAGPSIDDPSSGFQLMRSTDTEENLAEISSLYSEPCYDHSIKVSGTIKFGVWYRDEEQILYVRIKAAKGLAKIPGKDTNPYVKVHLLPNKSKHTKRKTGILRKTAEPEFDEIVKYKISREDLTQNTLWVSVWNWDITGTNKFLGEVVVPLNSSELDLSSSKDLKYTLQAHKLQEWDVIDGDESAPCGRICIGVKFELISGTEYRGKSKSSSPLPQSMSSLLSIGRDSGRQSIPSTPERKMLPSPEPIDSRTDKHNTLDAPQLRKGLLSIGKSASVDNPASEFSGMSLSPVHNPATSHPLLSQSVPSSKRPSLSVPGLIAAHRRSSNSIVGKLHVRIKCAEGLRSMDSAGDTNPFVRCFLLPNTTLGGKRKTNICEHTLDPMWDEELVYNMVKLEELLCSRVLEVSVWDMDRRGTNSFIGAVRLGPESHPLGSAEGPDWMDSCEEEVLQWDSMLSCLGEWVESWHNLRPSLESLHAKYRAAHSNDEINTVEEEEAALEAVPKEDISNEVTSLPKPVELNVNRRAKGPHYEISGEVSLGICYEKQKLTVKVFCAQGLAAVNKKSSDPYVKLYLLPDKQSKRKTKTKKKTLDPIYNQTFKYKISVTDLRASSLWVTVWSHEGVFQRNQFLGEICIPFDTYEFEVQEEKYYQLCDYSQLDMIPNPNLQRTRSTIYRVRTKLPEQPTSVPTLYDSSMDLRGEEEGKGDKESAALGGEGAHKQEDLGFTLPVINVESEDFRSQSHEESNVEAVNVQHTPSPTPSPETTSRPSSSMSQHKDEDQTKPNKKKSPKLGARSPLHSSDEGHSSTTGRKSPKLGARSPLHSSDEGQNSATGRKSPKLGARSPLHSSDEGQSSPSGKKSPKLGAVTLPRLPGEGQSTSPSHKLGAMTLPRLSHNRKISSPAGPVHRTKHHIISASTRPSRASSTSPLPQRKQMHRPTGGSSSPQPQRKRLSSPHRARHEQEQQTMDTLAVRANGFKDQSVVERLI